MSSAEAMNRRAGATCDRRTVGSTPEPIRAHWASTTIRWPFLPANRKQSTSFPAARPSTTAGAGTAWAASIRPLSSASATCGSWPTEKSRGAETPPSVWTRIGYAPAATDAGTVSLKAHASGLLRSGGRASTWNGNAAISRGFAPSRSPESVTSAASPRRTPEGEASASLGGSAWTAVVASRPSAARAHRPVRIMTPLRARVAVRAIVAAGGRPRKVGSPFEGFFNVGLTSHAVVRLSRRRAPPHVSRRRSTRPRRGGRRRRRPARRAAPACGARSRRRSGRPGRA